MSDSVCVKGGCIVVAILLLTGCSVPLGYSIEHYGGAIETKNNTFRMTGYVYVSETNTGAKNFSDVKIVLYNEQREVIEEVPIGTLSTFEDKPHEQKINITADGRPSYVLIESPDFWTSEYPVGVEGFVLVNGSYSSHNYGGPDEKFQNVTETS